MVLICNIFENNPTIKAGNWKIQLEKNNLSLMTMCLQIFSRMERKLSVAINITGNVTIDVNVPNTAASDGTTLITGKFVRR